MSEKFSLKWNDFQTNVSKSFKDLRNQNHFYDVTLVSSDQKQISAHKVVLSACSDYFQNILKQNSNSHPWLCLDGVTSTDINNMLDYVYLGEVQIYQEDLDRFLDIAQRFQLEGLLQQNEDENKDFYNENIDENDKTIISEGSSFGAVANFEQKSRVIQPKHKIDKIQKIKIAGVDLTSPMKIHEKVEEMYTRDQNNFFLNMLCLL